MKNIKYIIFLTTLVILTSCMSDNIQDLLGRKKEVKFNGKIDRVETRVVNNSWEDGDAIGVYALKAGETLSKTAIYNDKSNIKYTTNSAGVFSTTNDPIKFPTQGNVDFIAYYPYQNTINEYSYNIDVTTQNHKEIDLLYSNNAKEQNNVSENVDLVFKHMLSKLILKVSGGDNITSLEGLTVTLKESIVDGILHLADGEIELGTTKDNLSPIVNITDNSTLATVAAILLPKQNLENVKILFTLEGKEYEWTPTSQELASTTKYTYTLKLTINDSGVPVVQPVKITAIIDDWIEGNIDNQNIILTPIDNIGSQGNDGSKEHPYSITEAIEKQDKGTDVWVRGYIVGFNSGNSFNPQFSIENAKSSNIIIAENKDETDITKVIPVQLVSKSSARIDLNLADNPAMYKVEVLLKGDLMSYFSVPGLKDVKEYELVTK